MKTFAESGYYGASLADIAAGAGVSQTGLLHHFRSKQALLVAVLEYRDRMHSERRILTADEPLRGADALRHQIRMMERTSSDLAVQLLVVVTAEAINPDHPAHGWLLERYEWMVGWLESSLRLGIDDGSIRPDVDCGAIARQVFATEDGLKLQWLIQPDIDTVAIFTEYIDALIDRISC